MSKATPGPWKAKTGYSCSHLSTIYGSDGSYVAITDNSTGPTSDPEKYEANARLIAAAPDLLSTATEARTKIAFRRSNGIIAECAHCSGGAVDAEGGKPVLHTPDCIISRLDAAIAKATGEA